MKNIKLLLFLSLALFSLTSLTHKDKIKFTDGIITVNGTNCMLYERLSSQSIKISTLDSFNTIILKYINYEDEYGAKKQYTKVTFVEQQRSLTSKSYVFTKKLLAKNLLKTGVIKDCAMNESRINDFIAAYDEPIDKTILIIKQ